MLQFFVRRLVAVVPVLVGVSIFAFSMTLLVPGDPVTVMLGDRATAADVERMREQLGLNDPVYVQYFRYVSRAAQGDLGLSIRSGQPVMEEIAVRLDSTAELTFASVVFAVVIGLGLGTLAAVTRSPWAESLTMTTAFVGISMPTFWSGQLLILLFALTLGWLPATSSDGPAGLVLPAVTLALPAAAVLARMTRSSLLEVLSQDFVRTARSKGLHERSVVVRHALRNALIPVVTMVGLQFGGLMAGSVIVEAVFARPGIGRLALDAILQRDFPVVQGVVLLAGFVYVVVNTVADMVYGVLDPRIQVR